MSGCILSKMAMIGIAAFFGDAFVTTQPSTKASYSFPRAAPQVYFQPSPASEGSLYSSKRSTNLFSDVKARNVGDLVTINVIELATASKNATTKTNRGSGVSAGWSGVLAKLTGDWVGSEQEVNFENKFEGKGETTRSSQLSAYITAQVIQVLPNGCLVIRGSRQVRVNYENQIINVQGVIRTEDINADNIVLSTYFADARIELMGEGVVSDKQRPGWLARILDGIWPF